MTTSYAFGSDARIASLQQIGDAYGSLRNYEQSFYLRGNAYYSYVGGVGGGYTVTLDAVQFDGTYYYVTYSPAFSDGGDPVGHGTYQALLQYITVGDASYWSVLRKSDKPIF